MRWTPFVVILASAVTLNLLGHQAMSADLANVAKVFAANCAGCHPGGGNVVVPDKTLKKEALEKYGMATLEAIESQVNDGKNQMPAFKGRLSEREIEDVAAYVLERAEKGW